MAPARLSWWLCALFSASAAATDRPSYPPAPVRPVRDAHFGVEVVDPYRWMEDAKSPELAAFLEAQNALTRKTLERVAPARAGLLARIEALQRGTATVRMVALAKDRYFFMETPADGKDARLMTRDVAGGAPRVLLEPGRFASGHGHPSIDFAVPSRDGERAAVCISHGGGEDWTFRFVDATTGALLDDVVADLGDPFPAWTSDRKAIYYARLQARPAGAPDATKLENMRIYRHVLGTDQSADEPVFGRGVVPGIDLSAGAFPWFQTSDDGRYEIAGSSEGTESFRTYWIRDLQAKAPSWRKIADAADKVTLLLERAGRVYGLNQKGSVGQVVAFDAGDGTAARADVLIDDESFVVSTEGGSLAGAKDALYVAAIRDGLAVVRRVAYDGSAPPTEVALPASGALIEFAADQASAGFVFALQSPTLSPRVYRYDPAAKTSMDTALARPDPADFSGIETRELKFSSADGTEIPVSVTMRKDLALDGSHPTLIVAYGSYGAIVPPWFSAPNLAWYERGGILALAHPRGGGEKGEAWHLAAVKTSKQRTVDDVVAIARGLVEARYTSPEHLAIAGKSAGGVPAGAAIVQHPELFRAVLIRVGVTDLLRLEEGALGPANTFEFGSVKNEAEFASLRALSPYANVREGVAYPAVMLETGVNDPRVPSWQLAKMTARLQAATSSSRPILLRVDYDAGHGLGSDKKQIAELLADEYAFLGWQLGLPGFAPQ